MLFKKKDYIQLSGELFTDVQSKRIFNDSKTFVDSVPKENPSGIMEKYLSMRSKAGFNLKEFVTQNFFLPEDEPVKLNLPKNRSMEEHIISLWDYLVRKPQANQNYSTLIPLVDEYIVPGGRFREIYYWDSYFTMLGLFACKRFDLIRKMVNNFSYLIENFGFIPNGNRVYYLTRSQPPFFSLMVSLALKNNSDIKTELSFIPLLEKEYSFWMRYDEDELDRDKEHLHVVKVEGGDLLNRNFDTERIPREESFYEDAEIFYKTQGKYKRDFYNNVRAAGESGWDFSSRWFEDEQNLSTVISTEIIPLDLNCLLAFHEKLLSNLYGRSGNRFKTELFKERFEVRLNFIRSLFWNEEGFFFDYNFKANRLRKTYSLAGVFPLFFGFAEKYQAEKAAEKIEKLFLKDGGLLTTVNNTGQQWDSPNGWPPLQWITIIGLRNYGFHQLADKIKKQWLLLNESVFKQSGRMFEKYNVDNTNLAGGGGEYPLQDGFGWTNGVALALLKNLDHNFTVALI